MSQTRTDATTATAATREIEAHEFDAAVNPDRVTLVDFSATWCGPCRRLEPILGELAGEMPEIDFLKLDVDRSQEIAMRYGVQAVPTMLVLQGGRVIDRFVGLRSKGELSEKLRQHSGG